MYYICVYIYIYIYILYIHISLSLYIYISLSGGPRLLLPPSEEAMFKSRFCS